MCGVRLGNFAPLSACPKKATLVYPDVSVRQRDKLVCQHGLPTHRASFVLVVQLAW